MNLYKVQQFTEGKWVTVDVAVAETTARDRLMPVLFAAKKGTRVRIMGPGQMVVTETKSEREEGETHHEQGRELYDVALQVTDEVLGDGTYAAMQAGNPDPGVQAAIARSAENDRTLLTGLDVSCPTCKAQPGKPCRRPNGDKMTGFLGESKFHAKRVGRVIADDA